jgi:hypothetical protein
LSGSSLRADLVGGAEFLERAELRGRRQQSDDAASPLDRAAVDGHRRAEVLACGCFERRVLADHQKLGRTVRGSVGDVLE